MKNFNIPDWDGNKVGDKASNDFAKVGTSKVKASPKKSARNKTNNNVEGKKVSNASKAIKKSPKTATPKGKVKDLKTKAVVTLNNNNDSPKRVGNSPKKVVVTPKKRISSPKKVATPKTPQNKTNTGSLKGKSPKSHKKDQKSPVKSKNETQKVNMNGTKVKTPKTDKKMVSKRQKSKQSKVASAPSPKKSKQESPKQKSLLAVPNTKKSPGKSPKKNETPTKLTTPSINKKTPVKKQISTPSKKSPNKTSPSPKSKVLTPKLNSKSVVIKKSLKKKPQLKAKIKIAGLIGKKKVPKANSDSDQTQTPVKSRDEVKKLKKLKTALATTSGKVTKKTKRGKIVTNAPLRVKMMDRLQSARFRYLNEELYTKDSAGAVKLFEEDPDAFAAYHEGYRQQVQKWPMNPLTKIIGYIKKMSESHIIADFGCGDAELSKSVKQKVHSFDLVAANDRVTACDMAHVPLTKNSVDVAVFCLSLMGTNLQDYLMEANRVLKVGGLLMIAEVESRFDKVDNFITGLNRYGFSNVHKDFEHNLFYLMHFRKERDLKSKKNLPTMSLHPCIYKKR